MEDLLANLNEPQKQAVLHAQGPLLVLAGAGSGKTRVITRRVARLVAGGVAPWHVLAITFTNKAAREMADRVAALDVPRGATICTFHSLCAALLREFAVEAGATANYTIYDRDDQLRLVKQAMEKLQIPTDRLSPGGVHAAISTAKNDLKLPGQLADAAEGLFERQVALVYGEYQKLLGENNAMDFDDLLLRTAQMLGRNEQVRGLLSDRYRYLLIDEYQDTNRAQYLLARAIASGHDNIGVTGDPDQSIYAWRGADIRNILQFEKDFPNATVIRLEENYRSVQPILTAASSLIAHNRQRKAKTLWTARAGGAPVRVLLCPNEHEEARQIARRIGAYRAGGGSAGDVAIFYRINALSRVMEETLLNAGVAYRIARGIEFYNRKEIKDVLAYLKLLVNGEDNLSCLRIINTPARGLGATSVARLQAFSARAGVSLLAAASRGREAGLASGTAAKAAAFAHLIADLGGSPARPVRDVVEDVVRRSGLEATLNDDESPDRRAWENVGELISTAAEFDASHDQANLADYLQQVSLVSDVDHFDGGDGAVTLMTLHAAKGLEFPRVFILGCEDGLLPFERTAGPKGAPGGRATDLEEERRLAFVGMTRAREELTLTCARQRMVRGQSQRQAASAFLSEIGTEAVAVEDLTWEADPEPRRPSPGRGGFRSDAHERARIESHVDESEGSFAPPLPPEYEYLARGCRVKSPAFGLGHVDKIGQEPWPQTRVVVHFAGCGIKRLVLAQARLEILDP